MHKAIKYSLITVAIGCVGVVLLIFGIAFASGMNKTPVEVDTISTLVNEQRTTNGLQPVTRSAVLDKSAQAKCDDMVTNDYWSHDSPTGKTPWTFIDASGYKYLNAGENLAEGYFNSEDLVTGWMKSPSHRENILEDEFNEVGYAMCKYPATSKHANATLIVQHLAHKYTQ